MTLRINYTITIPKITTLLGRSLRLGLLAVLVVLVGGLLVHQTRPAAASNVKAVSAGATHTCALTSAGGVQCWGDNSYGELGDGQACGAGNCSMPVNVAGLASGVAVVSAGTNHTCALTTGGGVKCWGDNTYGELGDGQVCGAGICTTPVNVTGLGSGVAAVAAGGAHSCALNTAGGIKCWGANGSGQLGVPNTGPMTCASLYVCSTTPVNVTGLASGAAAVAAGGSHTCALTTGGGIKCWGANSNGQLGDGQVCGAGSCSTPVNVTGLGSGVAAVSAGRFHTCAVTSGGGVQCWGDNGAGQLGDGQACGAANCTTPASVTGLGSGIAAVSAGGGHTCALTTAGGVQCWGDNSLGQLGDGTSTGPMTCSGSACSTTPVGVTGLASGTANAVSAGGGHTCALTTGNGVKCWGRNTSGQLGVPNSGPMICSGSACSTMPVDVTNLAKTAINITLTATYHPPLSCYNVYDSTNTTLYFQVCDNDSTAPPSSSVCIDATHPNGGGLCSDLDPSFGHIRVALVPGDYHVVQSVAPPYHVASPGKTDCNTSSVPKCDVQLSTAPNMDPWFPWDNQGPSGPPSDGRVRIEDVTGVINHYRHDNMNFAVPAP